MSKIQDIILSGRAPGVRCGESAVDPDSVYALAPKAIKQMERGEKRSKRGIDAKDMSKYMGMSVDNLKKVWSKTNSRAFGCLILFVSLMVNAGDITPGTSFVDGQTVHAADFNNLVGNATINTFFFSNKSHKSPAFLTDRILFYDGSSIYYCDPADIAQNYQSISTLSQSIPSVALSDALAFYSSSNMYQVTFSNLVLAVGTNINLAYPNYTNIPTQSAFYPVVTNDSYKLLIWGTNGVGYSITYSNLIHNAIPWIGTNLNIPYVYNQTFAPWKVYGTNTTTNAWGYYTNFPISSIYIGTNTTTTLTDSDTIPITAQNQGTNTTVTLGGVYQYLTNKNTLPAYTQARIQFSGFPSIISISNDASSGQDLLHVASNSFPTNISSPYAVSMVTNGQLQIATMTTNQLFYVVPQLTNNAWVRMYSNYVTAVSGTNWMDVIAPGSGTLNQFLYLTNYTSFNADVTPVVITSQPTIPYAGIYDVWFKTNSSTAYYYVTGTCGGGLNGSSYAQAIVGLNNLFGTYGGYTPTTNKFQISTHYTDGPYFYNCSLVQVLVNPQ